MIKLMIPFQNLISRFKIRKKRKNDTNQKVNQNLQSNKLEKKLGLLIKNIKSVDQLDLKFVEYKKIDQEANNDLFTSYRLDFSTRDTLKHFKKKYQSLLL